MNKGLLHMFFYALNTFSGIIITFIRKLNQLKLDSIKISNILSFEYKENIDDCQEIKFEKGLNIIIGPNAAGKSNFLEVINKLFNHILTPPCVLNEAPLQSLKKSGEGNLRDVLGKPNQDHQLLPNHNSTDNPRKIKILINVDSTDKENLLFINQNVAKINQLSQKYSSNGPSFPANITEDEIKNLNEIELLFECPTNNNQFSIHGGFENLMTLVYLYFQNFYFLQQLIPLANKEESENWPTLKNSFAMMSGYRNYNNIDINFGVGGDMYQNIQNLRADVSNETTLASSNNEPKVFNFVRNKIGYAYHQLRNKIGTPEKIDPIEKFSDETFVIINQMLEEVLNLRLYITKQDPDSLSYTFSFIDRETNLPVNIAEFSSGQKGILHFIYSIMGYELKNGLMIIDEPELHLHPQIQQNYLNIISMVIEKMNLQFILATHSPFFVNSKTINGVKRFYKENLYTKVTSSDNSAPHPNMIKYLDYTNAISILYSDHVVLVEGESDAFVYRFLLDKFKGEKLNKKDVNILHIVGKSSYSNWKKFFDDWKITTFFIRDLDDFKGSEQDIEKKYDENIYILKQGNLETYIEKVKADKFPNAVDFCENRFLDWCGDSAHAKKIKEINEIFDNIIQKISL